MITPFYAALLALLFMGLSVRTLNLRRKLKISIGDNDNEHMLRAMRVHSNCAEYVPFSLLLALMVELMNGHWLIVHFVCSTLLIGRLIHAYGFSQINENHKYRVIGMALTFTSIGASALALLVLVFI